MEGIELNVVDYLQVSLNLYFRIWEKHVDSEITDDKVWLKFIFNPKLTQKLIFVDCIR